MERDEVEREAVARAPPAREPVEREPLERDAEDERVPDERVPDERVPDERDAEERAVLRAPVRAVPELERELLLLLRVEREVEVPDGVSAARSLSKSLSACLLVLAASRRSARSAAVTSL